MANKRLVFAIARAATVAAIIVLVALFALNIALSPAYAQVMADTWTPNITWTPEAARAALAELGWSPLAMVYVFDILIPLLSGALNIAVGLLILARKSRDWFGLFAAFVLVISGTNGSAGEPLVLAFPILTDPYSVMGALSWQIGFLLFYVFPDGQFVPRWTRWLLLGWLAVNLFGGFGGTLNSFVVFVPIVLVFSTLGSQVYRYFKHADAVGRQQTKWLVYGLILLILVLPIALLPFVARSLFLESGGTGLFWTLVIRAFTAVATAIIPISIAIAILRYRLWDIDILIRKTLTYAFVVALLALVYFGSVVLLQQLFAAVSGQRSEFITVLSTLGIAALFVPLRNRIQDMIDRRFYRKKYDAQQVLQDFSNTVRDETDLEKLTGRLMQVVDETMQPKSVSVSLKALRDRQSETDGRGRTG